MQRVMQEVLVNVQAYLAQHSEFAMFPLANLATYGLDGSHERAPRMWISDGPIQDVLTVTQGGMVMPFLPSGRMKAAANVLRDVDGVIGIIGPTSHVRALQKEVGLTDAPTTLDEDEPHFLLELNKLIVPKGRGELIPLSDAPEQMIRDWMADYQLNTLHTPAHQVADFVERDYQARVEQGSHMVLVDGEICLAKTGFNASLSDIVQIGGVYTPPDLRGQGHARRAVALHLELARQRGVSRSTLFSASEAAARAYRAIGFEKIGEWTLLLFDGRQVTNG